MRKRPRASSRHRYASSVSRPGSCAGASPDAAATALNQPRTAEGTSRPSPNASLIANPSTAGAATDVNMLATDAATDVATQYGCASTTGNNRPIQPLVRSAWGRARGGRYSGRSPTGSNGVGAARAPAAP